MKYAFLLGKNKDLSIAELASVFPDSKVNECGDMALVDCTLPYPPQETLNRLGGSLKILEIFEEGTFDTALPILAEYIDVHLTGKKIFGVNILNANHAKEQQELKLLLPALKKSLSGEGKVRFVNNQNKNVSEVFAKKQKLVEHGIEVNCVVLEDGSVLFGKTVAIQDFEDYSRRDYGKPVRDAKTGMLPPKLAQIMINLTRPQKDTTIYDPFCGTGTVMMEALMMGYNAVGSDLNHEMVNASQKNIEWLKNKFGIENMCGIFQKDATAITREDVLKHSEKTAFSRMAVVTEPLLGPPLSKVPDPREVERIIGALTSLYLKFFENLRKIASVGTRVVFIFPYIKGPQQTWLSSTFNELDKKIENLGFATPRSPDAAHSVRLAYDRENQLVGREIRVFEI